MEKLLKSIENIYKKNGICDFINFTGEKNTKINKIKCSIQLLTLLNKYDKNLYAETLKDKLILFDKFTNRKFKILDSSKIKKLEEYHKVGEIDSIDKEVICLLVNLGFYKEIEEYYTGSIEVYYCDLIKKEMKTCYKLANFILNEFLKADFDIQGKILKANKEIANLELAKIYKKYNLSLRKIEEYPFFSNGVLKKITKSTIHTIMSKEKEYNSLETKFEIEQSKYLVTIIPENEAELIKKYHFISVSYLESVDNDFETILKKQKINTDNSFFKYGGYFLFKKQLEKSIELYKTKVIQRSKVIQK